MNIIAGMQEKQQEFHHRTWFLSIFSDNLSEVTEVTIFTLFFL
jgi:hypothetical protein